ncbi:PDZ domain-containing guanine nucleotide exchange factor isoform X2 [Arctopsyche grandis]|uniref:PDZ domain-containing guanine nucleotide exchange factor isoform X2 n=1 Tax=Arctopsyche grandis TaxID=121162 RepID=UPI00406D9497
MFRGRHSPELYHHIHLHSHKCSNSSDTSSAYSGSDTMTSVHSSLDMDGEVDLSGLLESIVDSDEEEDFEETDSLTVRDAVRDCLEKDPSERNEDDLETLLEFTQPLKAFTNMTLTVRRALCSVMVFAVVEKAGTIVMNDGEEHDSWSVLINGHVEIKHPSGEIENLRVGDSFGMSEATLEKLHHRGIMTTRCDDCQFVCITQIDYYRILQQGVENTRRHEEGGHLVMITELRNEANQGHVVIRGTPDHLMLQLIETNPCDPTYVDDFLLTHRTFIYNPLIVANQLLCWFDEPAWRDNVTSVVIAWVNNHFTDFEMDPSMMDFLENFESCLEREKMEMQLRLLNITCTAKARTRSVTLSRSSRDEPLNFAIFGGYERGFGIFILKVDKQTKAEEVGLKRGDQILDVNGQAFRHVSHAKAIEIITGSTHLCLTVKSNLLTFKQMLLLPENSPRQRGYKVSDMVRWPDPRTRFSTVELLADDSVNYSNTFQSPNKKPPPIKKDSQKGFMTLGPKRRLQKALMKMNILPKNIISDGIHTDDSCISSTDSLSKNSNSFYNSHSNPDLISICYDELQSSDYPEHVLKVYKADQTCKHLLVHKETTAHEVVMLTLQEFGITDPSSHFSLCEVSVSEGGIIKQHTLPDQLQNLAERIGLSSRYYLKTNGVTETLVPDEMAPELLRESIVHFLQLNAVEVAVQLTLQDFSIFRQIESTEYIDDLFKLKSRYGMPMLLQFAELVNKEMFWVVTEVVKEQNIVRRSKIIKQFIKVARQCKECKNFNSMFAIISGLGHGAVSRLRLTWEKLPTKYQKLFSDLQELMDPSRNMSKYRQLVQLEQGRCPVIPFYPVVKKDLTFIHDGNDSEVENLVNFEKLRMIAKEVRSLTNMCNSTNDIKSLLDQADFKQIPPGLGQPGQVTVKRRKKSTAAPNPKKMFEEAQMVRRVKAYLNKMQVETDEERLHALSAECEGSGLAPGPQRKRHPSPSLSTTSSTSSASEGKKGFGGNKFGAASPQAVRKLLALSEPAKTRPHQPRAPPPPGPSPCAHRRVGSTSSSGSSCYHHGGRAVHERSHSDTPTPLPSVDLSAESSSVTSLVNLPLRKTGSVTSSDSGHSSCAPGYVRVPPPQSVLSHRLPPPYNLAAQLARSDRFSRAHSHEGVTRPYDVTYYHGPPEDDDEEQQVSAV